jgi:hypothetical protein
LKFSKFVKVLCNYFDSNVDEFAFVEDDGDVCRGFEKISAKSSLNDSRKSYNRGRKSRRRGKQFGKVCKLSDGLMYTENDIDGVKLLKADGVNGKYMGKSAVRFGSRAQTSYKPHISANFFFRKYKDVFDKYDVDVDKCVVVNGCYSTNIHTLKRTLDPEFPGKHSSRPKFEFIKETFFPTIRVLFRKLKFIPTFPALEASHMLHCKLNAQTKPGFRYEEILFKRTKFEAINVGHELAKKRWHALENNNKLTHSNIHPGVYTIGARGKKDVDYEENEVAVSRAVHMPELHALLTTSPWSDAIVNFIKNVKKGPIYIGNNFLEWFRFNRDMDGSSFVFEGDWRRFDSTLYANMITVAVAAWRCFFDLESDLVDRHFIGIYDSLVLKDYYVPGGKVYRMFHGLPSGVKETSFLGSIINLIAQIYCVGPTIARKFNFIVGGDDFVTVCRDSDVNSTDIKEKFLKRARDLGMEVKFLDVKYHNAGKLDDCPTFYKYAIWKGCPVVPIKAMLERVFMPWNKRYGNLIAVEKFLWDVMPSLGRPMSHLYIYYDYLSKT